MLAVGRSLNPQAGVPSFAPFTVTQLNTYFYHPIDKDDAAYNRRSVYRMHIITGCRAFLDALDCPSPSVPTPRRRSTTAPIQALALMNDSFAVRQADTLARRLTDQTTAPAPCGPRSSGTRQRIQSRYHG